MHPTPDPEGQPGHAQLPRPAAAPELRELQAILQRAIAASEVHVRMLAAYLERQPAHGQIGSLAEDWPRQAHKHLEQLRAQARGAAEPDRPA